MSGRSVASSVPHSSNNLLDAGALEQARAIRERRVSSEELVRGYLARIRQHNAVLNAFVEVAHRRAPRWARAKDAELRRGAELPPFHGVPIGIKDLGLVRGFRARFGARSLNHLWALIDDRTVTSIRRAGFVIIGKLATSEVGAMPVTEPDIHPPTRNPWNPAFTAGGSSGGSAAAVAARLLPIAHGSDGGGSIRIPSSFCHLFGFKPSRGRVKNPYGARDTRLLYTCGPIARSVEDAAALLDAMTNGLRPEQHFAAAANTIPQPLKIRYTLKSPLGETHPEHAKTTLAVLRMLEQMGHHIEEGPVIPGDLEMFLPLWQKLIASAPLRRSMMQPVTRWLVDGGKAWSRVEIARRHDGLEQLVDGVFGAADAWITPTVPVPAPRVGEFKDMPPEEAFKALAVLGGFTAAFNITGQPAASLPVGFSREGMPIGVQIVGRRMQDGLVLALARQLEQALPPLPAAPRGFKH